MFDGDDIKIHKSKRNGCVSYKKEKISYTNKGLMINYWSKYKSRLYDTVLYYYMSTRFYYMSTRFIKRGIMK